MGWVSTLASVGIALGSPLVYLDQYLRIERGKSSEGFSHLICVVLLVANISRVFYWLGERFDTALLVQSVLMIGAQLALLRLCLKHADQPTLYSFHSYLDLFALLFALEAALFILFQQHESFIQAMGFFSLGLESTLPIPQLLTNFRRKSLAGLSNLVLLGWLFGDGFKSIYLVFVSPDSNSIQFKICALFQLSIDILILAQAFLYRHQTRLETHPSDEHVDDDDDDVVVPATRVTIVDDDDVLNV